MVVVYILYRCRAKVDSFERFKGRNALNQPKESSTKVNQSWNEMGCEDKKAAVHQEISRMNKLPANSSYASHRLRVLNKILHLLSVQVRTDNFSAEYAASIVNFSLLDLVGL